MSRIFNRSDDFDHSKRDVVGHGPYMQTSTVALSETAAMGTIFQHRELQESFPLI